MAADSKDPAFALVIAAVLGVLGDALFHRAGWGLNVPIWIGLLVAAGAWLSRRRGTTVPWPVALVLFFAACAAWRASPFLRFWNFAAMLAAGVLVAVHLRSRLRHARFFHYGLGALTAALDVAAGPVLTASEVHWPWAVSSRRSRGALAIGVGIALAVPIVLVFGALLASADPIVEAFVTKLFQWNIETLIEHFVLFVVFGWLAAGGLRGMLARSRGEDEPSGWPDDAPWTIPLRKFGLVELGIPLGTLLVMLVSFVGLQARYLFGGESVIELTGMTYAQFARRGFFELVAVSALVVPVLLACQFLLDRSRSTAVESFRALVIALLIVVCLVMVSALGRLRLYVQSYGLTEDRLYASAFMGWVGVVLVLLAATEVRAQTSRFTTGAIFAGLFVVSALNVVNPDGLIAKTNIERANQGLELDVAYLNRLSTDAVPAIAARWASLDVAARATLAEGLMSSSIDSDWRTLSWSRLVAARAANHLSLGAPAGVAPESE